MSVSLPPETLQSILQKCPCRGAQVRQILTYYNHTLFSPALLVASGLDQSSKLQVITSCLAVRNFRSAIIKVRDCLSQRHLLSKIFAACVDALARQDEVDRGTDNDGVDVQQLIEEGRYDRVDGINALVNNLRRLFELDARKSGMEAPRTKLVLILDGIDRLRGASTTLLPALARLGDLIPSLSMILTSTSPRPLPLHRSGVPYLDFPPYTRAEAIHILTKSTPPSSLIPNLTTFSMNQPQIEDEFLIKTYSQFVVTVYDSLIAATKSTSLDAFRTTCERLWPRFIWPLVSGQEIPGATGGAGTGPGKTWDFARLLVRNRSLFHAEGEMALHDSLGSRSGQPGEGAWSFAELAANHKQTSEQNSTAESVVPNTPGKAQKWPHEHPQPASNKSKTDKFISTSTSTSTPSSKPLSSTIGTNPRPRLLKPFSTLLLLSSYLASTTPPKHDILLFSRLSSSSSHISKKIRRLKSTPSRKKQAQSSTTSATGTPTKPDDGRTPTKSKSKSQSQSRIMKTILSSSSISTSSASGGSLAVSQLQKSFSLERLLAILRAIHPSGIENKFGRGVGDRVYRELGELERLRLVVRADSSAGGLGGGGGGGGGGGVSGLGSGGGGGVGGATGASGAEDAVEEKWRVNVGRDWIVDVGRSCGLSVSEYEIEGDG